MLRRDMVRMVGTAALAGTASRSAQAPVRWDVSIPWGPTEFHTVNAQRFATEVRNATNGAVQMTAHPGGSLGVRANETVRAVGDGVVPMAEFAAFQNVGELPLLGIESVPFLIANYEELQTMHGLVRATRERTLTIAGLWGALLGTVRTCSMIGLIIVGALFLGSVRGDGGNSGFDRGVGLRWPSDLAARVELRRSHPGPTRTR